MKRILSFSFSLLFVCSMFATSVSAADSFPDLDQVSWAKDEINYLHKEGIIHGMPDGTFAPKEDVTRAQVVVMLVNDLYPEEEADSEPPFDDLTKSAYYYDEMAVAYDKGIIKGYDGKVRPKDSVSRAEAVALVDRAYDVERDGEARDFPDVEEDHWAAENIKDLSSQHIINGMPDGTFAPNQSMTRAAFSKVLAATIEPSFRKDADELSESEIKEESEQLQENIHTTLYEDLKKYEGKDQARDYDRIQDEVRKYATDSFSEEVRDTYYNACLNCDTVYYDYHFAWDIHMNVMENNHGKVVVETAQLEAFTYTGSFETITLKKEEGDWKLDAIEGEPFDAERHLSLSTEEAKQRVEEVLPEREEISYVRTDEKTVEDRNGVSYETNFHVFNDKDGSEIEVDASTGGVQNP